MHDMSEHVVARVERAVRDLVVPHRSARAVPVEVTAWAAPGEPVGFAEAMAQDYAPLERGAAWGRPWGTTWMRLHVDVPADWPIGASSEVEVDLGFTDSSPGFQCEGLAYDIHGRIIKGIEPRSRHVRVDPVPGRPVDLVVEAASNPDIGGDWSFRPTMMGDPETAGTDPLYRFGGADLVVVDDEVRALEHDVRVLLGIVEVAPAGSTRRAQVVGALDRMVDVLDPRDVSGSAGAARTVLRPALEVRAAHSTHIAHAVGHAHIDSAWLWPTRETVRKCARTFANVLDLMEVDPDFTFVASSAQQYAWIRDGYPDLFERIRARVAEGRFLPVGGMWVESDVNMPGGEAMVRQFLLGTGFFLDAFGIETDEVWLPDSFGYSAGLPQVMVAAGKSSFLTQKPSWNDTNRMPHHNFSWEGIDGTRILTHFPPVETYNSDLSVAELDHAARTNADKGVADLSLVPFGHGDGGGGPTREMLESARRLSDLDGAPRVRLSTPDAFFAAARDVDAAPPVWAGELYLEFHRGTSTSQAAMKAGNRRCEHLLRAAELWATTATVRLGVPYPSEVLRDAWETVLLQQFHDILPGTSIAWVHRRAAAEYERVATALRQVVDEATASLAGAAVGTAAGADDVGAAGQQVVFNAAPVATDGVDAMAAGPAAPTRGEVRRDGDRLVLEDGSLVVCVDADGLVTSIVHAATGREVVPQGMPGNDLVCHDDRPNRWDAWDVDLAYRGTPRVRAAVDDVAVDGDVVVVRRHVADSTVDQRLWVERGALHVETTVDWQEDERLLKLAFPLAIHADQALSEVQFGHVRRATHTNTSWDHARFETCGHRWVRVEEPGFGVTIANERTYGRDVVRVPDPAGGTVSVVRESLLRAPRFPDPDADRGTHVFRHALVPGPFLDGVAEAYRLNLPPVRRAGAPVAPLVRVTGDPSVLVEAVKLAEDGSGDVVVRLYECRGGRASATVHVDVPDVRAVRTDALERELDDQPPDALALDLRPFELVTIRAGRDGAPTRPTGPSA